jgi:propanediol dehydratase large subunit
MKNEKLNDISPFQGSVRCYDINSIILSALRALVCENLIRHF